MAIQSKLRTHMLLLWLSLGASELFANMILSSTLICALQAPTYGQILGLLYANTPKKWRVNLFAILPASLRRQISYPYSKVPFKLLGPACLPTITIFQIENASLMKSLGVDVRYF